MHTSVEIVRYRERIEGLHKPTSPEALFVQAAFDLEDTMCVMKSVVSLPNWVCPYNTP